MIKGTGIIKYDPPRPGMTRRTQGWCVALVDREITRYMRWFVNKNVVNPLGIGVEGSLKKYPFVPLHQPSWDAHISILRGEGTRLTGAQKTLWKKYDGCRMDFWYDTRIKQASGKPDFWIVNVTSPDMMQIRHELKLPTNWPLHLTIGRTYIWNNADEE